jgi:CBS domain-containing protein
MDKTTALDIMSTELITIREDETVEAALKALVNNRISGVPVIDANNKMVGVLSEYDLICQISKTSSPNAEVFQEPITFSRDTLFLPTSTPLADILKHFIESKFRRLPIVDKDRKLVGIVTRRDLMKLYFYRAKLT